MFIREPIDEVALCKGLTYDEGEAEDGSCEPEGYWAIKATNDSWWDAPDGDIGLDNRGTTETYLLQKVELVEGSDDEVTITNTVCRQLQPPAISDTLCAAFETVTPDETLAQLDPVVTPGQYSCLEKSAGCVLTTELETALFGLSMNDPDAEQLPATGPEMECPEGTGEECFPDHDGDGLPGVTATFRDNRLHGDGFYEEHSDCPSQSKPYEYRFAPPSAGISALTDVVQFVHGGSRSRLGVLSKELGESCGCGVQKGSVEISDSRVISCEVKPFLGARRPCTPAEADFIDSKASKQLDYLDRQGAWLAEEGDVPPDFLELDSHAPSPGAIFRGIRLGDIDGDFDCEDVVGATFPEPDISL